MDMSKVLPKTEGLEVVAKVLYDTEAGLKAAEKVMKESGLYSKEFTPQNFVDAFMGYAVLAAAEKHYKPKTAEECFLMNDAGKFVNYAMLESKLIEEQREH